MVAVGLTFCVPCGDGQGLHTVLPLPSAMEIDAGVPPATFQDKVDDPPGAIVAGEAVKLRTNGTVTVTVCGAEDPPGPVAVSV